MEQNSSYDTFVMALIGNKIDALQQQKCKIDTQIINELAKKHNMLVFEISAKTGEGVNELFL